MVLGIGFLCSCSGDEGMSPAEPTSTGDATTTLEPTPSGSDAVGTTSPPVVSTAVTSAVSKTTTNGADPRVQSARRQLADRFGFPIDEIVLVSFETLVWPSAALGCPRAERTYDSTPVPGYRIVLANGTLVYVFHGAAEDAPFHCEFLD